MTTSTKQFLISGYIRECQKVYKLDIPYDISIVINQFYPHIMELKGCSMKLTMKEKELITSWFINIYELQNNPSIVSSKLLYDYDKNGKLGTNWNDLCSKAKNTFTIVETGYNGHIFGCFLSESHEYKGRTHKYNDKVFLCLIRSTFKDKHISPSIFRIKPECTSNAYTFYKDIGPCFGHRFDLTLLNGYLGYGSNGNVVDHSDTDFQGDIYGNTLYGGDKYSTENTEYSFNIINMSTFEINLSS